MRQSARKRDREPNEMRSEATRRSLGSLILFGDPCVSAQLRLTEPKPLNGPLARINGFFGSVRSVLPQLLEDSIRDERVA
jgi:hypothetical protein